VRIPRIVRKKPAFRRRASPPPAARKLLLASLASGLVLLVMLAIVFVPRGLLYGDRPTLPRIEFALNTTGGTRVVVSLASLVLPLSDYRANYSGPGILESIDPLANGSGNSTFRFFDMDRDGRLGIGDEFRVAYNGVEVLRLVYKPGDAIVGYWPPRP